MLKGVDWNFKISKNVGLFDCILVLTLLELFTKQKIFWNWRVYEMSSFNFSRIHFYILHVLFSFYWMLILFSQPLTTSNKTIFTVFKVWYFTGCWFFIDWHYSYFNFLIWQFCLDAAFDLLQPALFFINSTTLFIINFTFIKMCI